MIEIKNRSHTKVINVAGLAIPPGRRGTVPIQHYQAWLRQSQWHREIAEQHIEVMRAPEPQAPPTPVEPSVPTPVEPPDLDDAPVREKSRQELILEGMQRLSRDEPLNWNKDGAPNLDALRLESGIEDVTGDERDELWKSVRESADTEAAESPDEA